MVLLLVDGFLVVPAIIMVLAGPNHVADQHKKDPKDLRAHVNNGHEDRRKDMDEITELPEGAQGEFADEPNQVGNL